jgi:tRNA threonylcarbamoyladenosine biosynthesis protein TsaE
LAAASELRSESRILPDEAATLAFGEALAPRLPRGALVFLRGDLGAGKTTLVRGILRGLGHSGSVKSPTYTLLEPYALANCVVYHFDLYRIADREELDFIGIDELLESDALKLVEWPERGEDRFPAADVEVRIQVHGEGRQVDIVVHG